MLFAHFILLVGFYAISALSTSVSQHHQYQHLHFHLRRQNASFPLVQNASATDPVIAAAESILAQAVIQQGLYNTWRVENPLRNTYISRHSPQAPSATRQRKRSGEPVAPHLNNTILAAAAVVAHRDALAQAANGTLNPPLPPPPAGFQADADQAPTTNLSARAGSGYWVPDVARNGLPPMGAPAFPMYRDVTDPQYAGGAKGDGIHDDTAAINAAIAAANNCGANCLSSSIKGTLVYFPPGTYLISSPINAYYYSQLVGHANSPPTIKTSANFIGLGAIQTDVYVPNGASAEWYIEQSNFYRQVRNFIIDIRATTTAKAAGLHWQVAQATSLLNVQIYASTDSASTQMGMFTENGSSGFMSDVSFSGGQYGLYGGNQQYTVRSFRFDGQHTAAICLIWDWGWTWSDLYIQNTPTAILIINPDLPHGQQAGSTYIMDSAFHNVFYAISATAMKKTILESSVIALDNCVFGNVLEMVHFDDGTNVPVPSSGTVDFENFGNVQAWGVTLPGFSTGNTLPIRHPSSPLIDPSDMSRSGVPNPIRPRYFRKSRPQYSTLPASSMLNVKNYGAKGDGVTDDTQAIRNALKDATYDNVIYFPAGSYIITSTIVIPKVCRITGRVWSQLVAKGSAFSQLGNPTPMIKVGNPGDIGTVEISDILFTSIGPLPGLVMVEWNIAEEQQGSAGIWDAHFRVGGAYGTHLSLADCPISTQIDVAPNCWAAAMMLHITPSSTGYFENMWAWVADHDLDDPKNTQITVGVGRGILIESQNGPVWMYGTASEHSILYQYNFFGASNVFAGMIQTESPYYQGGAFGMSPGIWADTPMPGDPIFGKDSCDSTFGPLKCDFAWAVIASGTTNLTIAGAGLYSWFDNYDQSVCVDKQNCQQRIFLDTGDNDALVLTNLVTIGAVEMLTNSGKNETIYAANNTQAIAHPFWSMLALYFEDANPWDLDCDQDPNQNGCAEGPLCNFTRFYNNLDDVTADLNAGVFDPSCVDYYSLGALQTMLLASINNYTSVADGYDDVFGYYTEYVKDLVEPAMQQFLNVSGAPGNQYFTCTHDDGHGGITTTGCPNPGPAGDLGWNKIVDTYNLVNSSGFYAAVEDQYGLTQSELTFGHDPESGQVQTCTDGGKPVGGSCKPYTMDTYGWPIPVDNFQVDNPKDKVQQMIPNVTSIANLLFATQLDLALGFFSGNPNDMVQVLSVPVFMFIQGVESMAEAKAMGQKQQSEDRAKVVNLVLTIVFAVLALIPGAGEGTLGGLAAAGRLAGNLGSDGMGFYDIAKDPSSAPMALIGMFAGGGGWKDAEDLAARAATRRSMPADTITNLGRTFKTLDDKLQGLTSQDCKL
ncbi:glycoside hydrolase family 55 protein [Myriangium duriaei CBS 260.36]|uniref:Glycoside hydrolase family 55 protein n=1 Tax=Myriangium duriaei CBS 260.36 TaxID=1168546 RepID=A0A9P4J7E6_9PEZI|nr:glycoside hydrolase family 55 protein [Myriangium duriaei CBS 260.36]